MRRIPECCALCLACILAWSLLGPASVDANTAEDQARAVLETAKAKGGLLVHLGCGDGQLTATLGCSEKFLVQGVDRNEAAVAKGKASLLEQGIYGRVSLRVLHTDRLPYVDQSVNLLVVERPLGIPPAELQRVLAPLGCILTRTGQGWQTQQKPWPEDTT